MNQICKQVFEVNKCNSIAQMGSQLFQLLQNTSFLLNCVKYMSVIDMPLIGKH